MTDRPLHRPTPMGSHNGRSVDDSTPVDKAAAALIAGETLLVTDRYRTGLTLLDAVDEQLGRPTHEAGHEARRAFQQASWEASQRLLVPIRRHKVALEAAPVIGFLRVLYPERADFTLPFGDLVRLHNAWRAFDTGTHLAVLGHKVHPFYGTYAPTRTSHLELFGTWLSGYEGPRTRAIDVGTGCGVLALQLCRAGFEHVLATDINPNAIESVRREVQRLPTPPPIELLCADLLGDDPTPADLIVFNPPWMKGPVEGLLDRALYFEDGLFERFFSAAHERVTPSGRVVLLFSSLIRLVQPEVPHPLDTELERGRFELVSKLKRKVEPSTTRDGRRRNTRERVEVWELKRT